jgi:hypothetical protein
MKKVLLLLTSLVVLSSCEKKTELHVYNFCSKNPWDDYSYSGHGLLVESPIESPYKFTRCYVDWLRTQNDTWAQEHVRRYDEDTNSVYIRYEGTWVPTSHYVTRDYCDIKVSPPIDVVGGDTIIYNDVDERILRRFHKPRD